MKSLSLLLSSSSSDKAYSSSSLSSLNSSSLSLFSISGTTFFLVFRVIVLGVVVCLGVFFFFLFEFFSSLISAKTDLRNLDSVAFLSEMSKTGSFFFFVAIDYLNNLFLLNLFFIKLIFFSKKNFFKKRKIMIV